MDDVNQYHQANIADLLRALSDPASVRSSLENIGTSNVERVLDIGCGIGQALYPLAASNGAFGVGVDVIDAGLHIGRDFYAEHLSDARVSFVHSRAESLPFADDTFDVVNCGLALPYMDNARAIAQVARVLRPGGIFLLKIHHPRYYLKMLWTGLLARDFLSLVHGGRVLVAGTVYHLTGRQPRLKLLNESFQT